MLKLNMEHALWVCRECNISFRGIIKKGNEWIWYLSKHEPKLLRYRVTLTETEDGYEMVVNF